MTIWTRSALVAALSCLAAWPSLSGATVTSFYDLKTTTLLGQASRSRHLSRQGHARRQRGELLRLHAAVQGPREAAPRAEGQGLRRPRLPEQRLRRAGARHCAGDRRRSASAPTTSRSRCSPRWSRSRARAVADLHVPRHIGPSARLELRKYLIGKDGKVIAFYPSDVTPESPESFGARLTKALAAN